MYLDTEPRIVEAVQSNIRFARDTALKTVEFWCVVHIDLKLQNKDARLIAE